MLRCPTIAYPLIINMKIKNSGKKLILLTTVTILVFLLKQGHDLRSNSIDIIPKVHLDEYTWVWQGISTRKTGIPAGWSDLNAYTKGSQDNLEIIDFNIWIDKKSPNFLDFNQFPKPALAIPTLDLGEGEKQIRFVQPLIEQPALGGIIMGIFVPENVNKLLDVMPLMMRRSSLLLASLTAILLFLLSFQLFKNPWISLLSVAIYGSVPSFNLMSRYALPENALITLVLVLFNILVFSKRCRGKWLILILSVAGLIGGIIPLVKITGWPFIFSAVIWLILMSYPKKYILSFFIPALLIGSLFFIWGIYLAPKLFFEIIFTQSFERSFLGSINFLISVVQVRDINFPIDGWWIGGFLALVLIPFNKEYLIIYVGALTTFLTALFFGGQIYPWYLISAIPFLCLASALFIWRVATEPNFKSILVFLLIFLSSSFYWGYSVFKSSQPFLFYRIILIFFLVSGLIFSYFDKPLFKKVWFIVVTIVVIQILKWNDQSTLYVLGHWGNLPYQFGK